MQKRHEWKIEISAADAMVLRKRLWAICKLDSHAIDGAYRVRSLYFDDPRDRALREKLDGINRREKFRLRYYNGDPSMIHLERKSKENGLGTKQAAALTTGQVQKLLEGDLAWMPEGEDPLVRELYCKLRTQGLRPRTVVDYVREPFVYGPGNVRVTLDYNIRLGLRWQDFLDPDCLTIPAGEAPILLEVKWDQFLPAVIKNAVQLPGRRAGAYSKYAACRIYG